ncbi:ATP-dependent helicase [Rheinheimera marina]|uniref:DNA 3'-5' helicase n=1 Tax=Rheinheimera marina TaxID=1774958 RepID=A0ABV9JHR9_9GAMM
MASEAYCGPLNPGQLEAVTFEKKHALVLAGPGCGKTKVIVARAAHLISTGVPPERILILTFTRLAASEIIERVELAMRDSHIGLRGATFHTWCSTILRNSQGLFGPMDFTVMQRDDQLQLFKMSLARQAPKGGLPCPASICDLYSEVRNTLKKFDQVLARRLPRFVGQRDDIVAVIQDYEERKRQCNYVDFDDLLFKVMRKIEKSPEHRAWLGLQYDYILVDEMQDTNPLQWALLQPLTEWATLFCVGDDAQSIYGFRGADFQNVHCFQKRLPDSAILRLQQNYRSTQEILDLSNWLMSVSPIHYGKNLRAVCGSGHVPELHTFNDAQEEAFWIAKDLVRRHKSGVPWQSHMVLVRTRLDAEIIKEAFAEYKVPFVYLSSTPLFETGHIKDVLSALRVVANHRDELGWMRYLTLWAGVGEVTATKVSNQMIEQSNIGACLELLSSEKKIPKALIEVLQAILALPKQVSAMIKTASTLMTEILKEKYKDDWHVRQHDFNTVQMTAESYVSILAFLEDYVLEQYRAAVDKKSKLRDAVCLTTIHSAKGSERNVCYVPQLSVGRYPSKSAIGDADSVEEERRVLYVAVTRAKKELILTRHLPSDWELQKGRWPTKTKVENGEQSGLDIATQLHDSYFLKTLPSCLVKL